MAITAISRYFSDDPNIVGIITTDNLTAITTTDYFSSQKTAVELLNNGVWQWAMDDAGEITDLVLIFYATDQIGFFTYDATTDAFVSLAPNGGLSNTLPSGDIFVGNGANVATPQAVTGAISMSNAGVTAINSNYITNAMINSAAAIAFSKLAALTSGDILVGSAGNVATAVAMSGAATISNAGVVTLNPIASLGASGTASSLTMFPPTASNGSLKLVPVNAGANNNTTISNGTMGQSTVYTIPDIGASTGDFVVATGAVRMKMVDEAVAAGGAAAQSFTDAFCTSTSVVLGTWVTQTTPEQIITIVPGNGSFVVTSTGDAGAGTFSYVILK